MLERSTTVVLGAALVLCLFTSAFAEIRYFTHIQADVPPGWSAMERDRSVILAADDKSAVLTITVQSSQGDNAQEIAGIISRSVNGTAPTPDEAAAGYFFDFAAKEGGPGKGFVKVDGQWAIVVAIMGENPQVAGIIDSLSGQVEF